MKNKIEYVVNNGCSLSTKSGIIAPGQPICLQDFWNEFETFNRHIEAGRIIEADKYKPKITAGMGNSSSQVIDGQNVTKINLRSPDYIFIPDVDKTELINFIDTLKIPENRISKAKLQEIAFSNYRQIVCMLNHLSFQKKRIPVQALESTKRMLNFKADEIKNHVPAMNGLKAGTFL